MRLDLALNYVQAANQTRFSEPFPTAGGNAVSVHLVALSGALSSVALQQSDDLENWQAVSGTINVPGAAPAHQLTAVLGVGAQYRTLEIGTGQTGTGFATVAMGLAHS